MGKGPLIPTFPSLGRCAALAVALAAAAALGTAAPDRAWLRGLPSQFLPLESPGDLAPLVEAASQRRAVLLGESTHGTREYYEWRAELSRRLIIEAGFRFIAVEGDWEACLAVDRYVREGEGGSAREVLLGFDRWPRWMWANEETLELVEWLRDYNRGRAPEERVGFYGLDIYGWGDTVQRLPGYFGRIDPELEERVLELMGEWAALQGSPERFLSAQRRRGFDGQTSLAALEAKKHGLVEEGRVEPRLALKLEQSIGLLGAAKRHLQTSQEPGPVSWNHRAENFHHTLVRLLEHYGPESKGIAWAHNTHIGDARATPMGAEGMVNIGQLTREQLGREAVFLVGFACHQGEVIASRRWGGRVERMVLPPAATGSLEAVFFQSGIRRGLLPLWRLREDSVWERSWAVRAVGVTYDPQHDRRQYVPSELAERFDALIYLERTRPLRPLHP
ncbi:MAG: erythromycin esterase family protein [Puniceicoccaceae bacterium]|nr:MAG: erythromycin esterase family protein [Puniceicoccaceae bacterium]